MCIGFRDTLLIQPITMTTPVWHFQPFFSLFFNLSLTVTNYSSHHCLQWGYLFRSFCHVSRNFRKRHDARCLLDHSTCLNLTLRSAKQPVLCGVYSVRREIKVRKVTLFPTKCSSGGKRPVLLYHKEREIYRLHVSEVHLQWWAAKRIIYVGLPHS